MKKILFMSHDSGAPGGPVDKLFKYLSRKNLLLSIKHPLFPTSLVNSTVEFDKIKFEFKIPGIIQYPTEGLITSLIILYKLKKRPQIDLTICFDPLSFLHAYLFRWVIRSNKIIYYNLDYSRKRFSNVIMDFIYNRVNHFAYVKCDFFFSLTTAIVNDLDPKGIYKNKNFLLKHTTIINNKSQKRDYSLIYAGAITTSMNFEPLLMAIKKYIKKNDTCFLDIYGKENDHGRLRDIINNLGLTNNISLKGPVEMNRLISEIIPQYQIGVAVYKTTTDKSAPDYLFTGIDLTAKIVDYIAAGLPVITTRLNSSFDLLETKKFGFLATNESQWTKAIESLLDNKTLYNRYSLNAIKFAKNYSEEKIYNPIFKKIF